MVNQRGYFFGPVLAPLDQRAPSCFFLLGLAVGRSATGARPTGYMHFFHWRAILSVVFCGLAFWSVSLL